MDYATLHDRVKRSVIADVIQRFFRNVARTVPIGSVPVNKRTELIKKRIVDLFVAKELFCINHIRTVFCRNVIRSRYKFAG